MLSTGTTEVFIYEAVKTGIFQIREDGTLWREKRGKLVQIAKRLPPTSNYLSVKVMRKGKQVSTTLQRLVYYHFHGSIPPGLTVNHKDGITTNNRPENLELATYVEQVRHARQVLGRKPREQNGENNLMAKLTKNAVREIRRRRAAGQELKEIAKAFGISDRTVSKIARGERWKSIL